jgi:hypothetical protein
VGVLYVDDFTGSPDGTLLTAHNSAWTETYSSNGGSVTILSGVCTCTGTYYIRNVLTGVVPPSADYAVEAVLARKTATTRNIYLCARCSADGNTYYAFYHQRSGSAILRKTIDGSSTTLGEVTRGLPENGSEVWRIAIEGTRILCTIDGVTIFDVNDTAIADGVAGLHFYTAPYDPTTDGPVVDSFMVETLDDPAAITGTLSIAMPAPAVAMTGSVDITGDLHVAMPAPVVDMAGSADVTGALDVAMSAPVVAMSGVVEELPEITGSLAILMPAPAVQMSGIVRTPGELLPEDVWAVELVEGVTAGQMLTELWRLAGLDASAPMTVTTRERVAGPIRLAIGGDGRTSSTITRQ